jgi:drug/metabolite transporter (DMT)-like permease
VAGGFGIAGSALLVFVGLAMTRPEVAVIILMLQPAMTAIAQWLLRGVRPALFTVACLGLAFFGVVVAVTRGGDALNITADMGKQELIGNGLVFLGAVAWITYTLMLGMFAGWSPLRFTALTALPGLVVIVLVWCIAWMVGAADWPSPTALVSIAPELAYVSLLGVVAAMFLWNAGNRRIGPLNTILLLNLMPVVTFAIRYAQGAQFATSELVGAGLVVGSLVANNLYERRRRILSAPGA